MKNNWLKLLIGATVGGAASLLPAIGHAREISNTAEASWGNAGAIRTVRSNTVLLEVDTPTPPIDAKIYAIQPPGTPGIGSFIDSSGCSTGGQGIFGTGGGAATGGAGSGAVSLNPSNQFTAGQPVAFGINSAADNLNPNARDTLAVTIRTANGDEESLILREDAVNSGFFVGYLATIKMPPPLVQHDCRLSVSPGGSVAVNLFRNGTGTPMATAQVSFLVDPFGIVFDSGDGAPVSGVRVTLINADTGLPAQVFGDDGVSSYPNSMVTGTSVTDSGGTVYNFPTGDYRFPFVAPGNYRLRVEPNDPYHWPSTATPAELAPFRRPDNGAPYTITDGSYGAVFRLMTPAPVRIDIPIDRPAEALILTKTASEAEALPGGVLQYRIRLRNGDARRSTGVIELRDDLPRALRLRRDSVRFNGASIAAIVAADGRSFTLNLPSLAPSAEALVTYLAEVRPDAAPGDALNVASARDSRGTISNTSDANVRIRRDILGERLTIIGRITTGGCAANPNDASGIGGVRVMMEDGRFAVTDPDGRYHFEGVQPGTHVVQMDPTTLPAGQVPVDCARNVESAGNPLSRFAEGRGGQLIRADFHAVAITSPEAPADAPMAATPALAPPPRPDVASDVHAAGGDTDFFAGRSAGISWVFPDENHNPRTPAIRIAIQHLSGQNVQLMLNGNAVDPLNYDGASASPDGSFRISVWRGVALRDGDNLFVARVVNADGSEAARLERHVALSGGAMRATILPQASLLIADGLHRPVIAVRLTDRYGRPVRQGVVGDFSVDAPHRAAIEADAEQERQLSGLESRPTNWRVAGDDGIAYIELQPTSTSGTARLNFTFRNDQVTRDQTLDVWLNPGDRPWTIVGFAAGTLGYNTLDAHMESVAEDLPGDNVDGRIALYAKGRILGQWLMTLSYDSDRERDDSRFGGVIDPRAYYTIFADRSDNGFDAASVRNLYVRLERPQFHALFGDFETGLNDTVLARYQRALNGGRAEYNDGNLALTAFVADTPYRHSREEFQGNGLSGPYQLRTRDILANSERITIEVRDRLRSDIVLSSEVLTRHIDYDIDYFAGTLRFRQPILSRDSDMNPRFIVADYEVNGVGARVLNAGGRAAWTNDSGSVRVGASFIHDETDSVTNNLGGVDVRLRPSENTEIRAEFALSNDDRPGSGTPHGWLVEVEHHSADIDLLAYARERESGFGVGQLSASGDSSRRIGFDATWRFARDMSLLASAWQEDYMLTGARRRAARLLGEWRSLDTSLRAGITHADDRLSDGSRNNSNLIQLGASQRLFGQKLELSAQSEFALGGDDASVDFPARHSVSARVALIDGVALIGSYELADGSSIKTRTGRIGFDVTPWAGGRINLAGASQNLGEYGPRSFAAYGLSQSLQISDKISVDMSIDGQRTLGGVRFIDILNPAHPVASGGMLDGMGTIVEDFLAISTGATYRTDDWSLALRGEWRDGEVADRRGVTLGAIRRIGDGVALGGLGSWTRAKSETGVASETAQGELSLAYRPASSRWAVLDKLEFAYDEVTGAVFGTPGPIGGPVLNVSGDVRSSRVMNSLAINYSPLGNDGEGARSTLLGGGDRWHERGEYALFWGVRYASTRYGPDDVAGWSTVIGGDARFDVSAHIGIGISGNFRIGTDARARSWSLGPQIVLSPMRDANLIIGYNINGYRDRDFEDARYSREGAYVTFRLKFDQTSLGRLFGNAAR